MHFAVERRVALFEDHVGRQQLDVAVAHPGLHAEGFEFVGRTDGGAAGHVHRRHTQRLVSLPRPRLLLGAREAGVHVDVHDPGGSSVEGQVHRRLAYIPSSIASRVQCKLSASSSTHISSVVVEKVKIWNFLRPRRSVWTNPNLVRQ